MHTYKPRVFKDPSGQWAVFWAENDLTFLGIPLRISYHISRWDTWAEALQEANTKTQYETLRKELT